MVHMCSIKMTINGIMMYLIFTMETTSRIHTIEETTVVQLVGPM